MRRCGLAFAFRLLGRALLYVAGVVAFAAWVLRLAGCTSVPLDSARIGCAFDSIGRFNYALILSRDEQFTSYVYRRALTGVRDSLDTETRIGPSIRVRIGYCPDEQQHFFGRQDPWKQTEDEGKRQ